MVPCGVSLPAHSYLKPPRDRIVVVGADDGGGVLGQPWYESAGFSVAVCKRNGYAQAMLARSEIQREALNLPAQERIQLVVELWDSLAPGEIPVPDWQRDLICDRLAELENVLPEERSVPWDALRKRTFSDEA